MSEHSFKEPDFGARHSKAMLVEDDEGTVSVAFYEDGVWWEGHPTNPDGTKAARIQLDREPVKLHEGGPA